MESESPRPNLKLKILVFVVCECFVSQQGRVCCMVDQKAFGEGGESQPT